MTDLRNPIHRPLPEVLDRIINSLFLFALIFIFLLIAKVDDHIRILLALLLSGVFVTSAFMLNWLTIDGASSAFVFGLIAYGLGGFTGAALILSFFISSSLISKDLITEEGFLQKKFRRNGLQVWSNGFWFCLWIIVWFLSDGLVFLLAAAASVAFANSDTWSSEVGGHRVKGKTRLVTNFKEVKPGTDGGVSLAGTLAAVAGSLFITIVFWMIEREITWLTGLIIAVAGLAGSFVDSYLGATIQYRPLHSVFQRLLSHRFTKVDNNMVNWLASGSASIAVLLLFAIFGPR